MSFPVPLPSTFMPLPLAIMIPFMGIQSGVMAQQFGMNFQYGKRKISAMSNEEFNKLTPQQLQADFSNMITGLIPTFGDSLREMRPFQRMIFEEMLAVMKVAVDLGIDVAKAGVDPLAHVFGQHIHGEGVSTGTPTIHPQDKDKFQPPVSPPTRPGIKFERTLAQAQADTSRSRGTGKVTTVRRKAGQTQFIERTRLRLAIRRSRTQKEKIVNVNKLSELLRKYRF